MKKVDIVIPVYHGNLDNLEWSIKNQVEFYHTNLKEFEWGIIISINGKNPKKILEKSKELSEKYKEVNFLYTSLPGKGYGVINAWKHSKADIMVYMDVDLATDLKDLKNLIEPVILGKYDICTGSRYHPNSNVKRKLIRNIISMGYYYFITKFFMGVKYRDAQCGFKAVNKKIVDNVIPLIKNYVWFFDSELMFIAQKKGYKIKEIPVSWRETWKTGIRNFSMIILSFIKKSIELKFRNL